MADALVTGLRAQIVVAGRLEVAITAERGEVLAIIGPNGAGKSTLLKALAGTVPCRGDVELDGRSWTSPVLPVQSRGIGMVFQQHLLFPHLSVVDNVMFGPRSRGMARAEAEQRALDWLRRLDVVELADRRPAQLSGGQAQRVALARALVGDPAVLMMDEPFSSLDVGVAAALRTELARHLAAYAGITLLVTHDAIDALTLADRVIVLDEGSIVQSGSPLEVAARPRTEHVARLVGLNVVSEEGRFLAFSPGVVTVSLAEPVGSARHRWFGRVTQVSPHGTAVRLLVTGAHDVLADVTPEALGELGLRAGSEVWVSVKESAVQSHPAVARSH